jgi:hypothetical protein
VGVRGRRQDPVGDRVGHHALHVPDDPPVAIARPRLDVPRENPGLPIVPLRSNDTPVSSPDDRSLPRAGALTTPIEVWAGGFSPRKDPSDTPGPPSTLESAIRTHHR